MGGILNFEGDREQTEYLKQIVWTNINKSKLELCLLKKIPITIPRAGTSFNIHDLGTPLKELFIVLFSESTANGT